MYKFKMSIGDWSDDGHGKHEDYIIESNFPVERVREAHFAMKDRLGISIEDFCCEYEEDYIDEYDAEIIQKLGYEFEEEPHQSNNGTCYSMTAKKMADLWVFLLMKSDPELRLKVVDEDYPTFHFYGFDDKKRHIEQVGYGCFY